MSIRMATVADVPQLLEIYGPYILETAISFEYTVPTQESFTERFLRITAQFPWLVWEEDGELLGYAYGSAPFDRAAYGWCSEASVYLRPQARGRGIGKRLYYVLEALLQAQGYGKVYAIITTANEASVAFHKAVGYRHTATMPRCGYKFGQWYGTVWMEKVLPGAVHPGAFPVSIWKVVKLNEKMENILDKMSLLFGNKI